MNTHKVVMKNVNSNRGIKAPDGLGEGVGKPGVSTHAHPHGGDQCVIVETPAAGYPHRTSQSIESLFPSGRIVGFRRRLAVFLFRLFV